MAIITQKQQNIFYSGNIVEEEEEKQETKMNSRRYSIDIMNFDYDTGSSSDSYQMQSSSFPPKDQKDILRSKKFLNVPNYFFFSLCWRFFFRPNSKTSSRKIPEKISLLKKIHPIQFFRKKISKRKTSRPTFQKSWSSEKNQLVKKRWSTCFLEETNNSEMRTHQLSQKDWGKYLLFFWIFMFVFFWK